MIIVKRVAKSIDKYILQCYDFENNKLILVLYDRNKEIIERKLNKDNMKYIKDNFKDYDTGEDIKDLSFDKTFINKEFDIHCFDKENDISLRKFIYSFKKNKILFIPCCGKHKDHENIKKWGKFINNFEIKDIDDYLINIEGYIVNDILSFDMYILKLNPDLLEIKFFNNSSILLSEFKDFISSMKPNDSISSITLKFNSGSEIDLR